MNWKKLLKRKYKSGVTEEASAEDIYEMQGFYWVGENCYEMIFFDIMLFSLNLQTTTAQTTNR